MSTHVLKKERDYYKVIKASGDGNCYYHAFAYSLNQLNNTKKYNIVDIRERLSTLYTTQVYTEYLEKKTGAFPNYFMYIILNSFLIKLGVTKTKLDCTKLLSQIKHKWDNLLIFYSKIKYDVKYGSVKKPKKKDIKFILKNSNILIESDEDRNTIIVYIIALLMGTDNRKYYIDKYKWDLRYFSFPYRDTSCYRFLKDNNLIKDTEKYQLLSPKQYRSVIKNYKSPCLKWADDDEIKKTCLQNNVLPVFFINFKENFKKFIITINKKKDTQEIINSYFDLYNSVRFSMIFSIFELKDFDKFKYIFLKYDLDTHYDNMGYKGKTFSENTDNLPNTIKKFLLIFYLSNYTDVKAPQELEKELFDLIPEQEGGMKRAVTLVVVGSVIALAGMLVAILAAGYGIPGAVVFAIGWLIGATGMLMVFRRNIYPTSNQFSCIGMKMVLNGILIYFLGALLEVPEGMETVSNILVRVGLYITYGGMFVAFLGGIEEHMR